jgi:hypothetical protein
LYWGRTGGAKADGSRAHTHVRQRTGKLAPDMEIEMERNTALLWALVAESVSWASRQPHDYSDAAHYARVENDARAKSHAGSTTYLAKNLVDALASLERRGLVGALEDIKDEIGEVSPAPSELREALNVMVTEFGTGSDAFIKASRVVRVFLNLDVGRKA